MKINIISSFLFVVYFVFMCRCDEQIYMYAKMNNTYVMAEKAFNVNFHENFHDNSANSLKCYIIF